MVREQAKSASIKPRPRQERVAAELPRQDPPKEARTEAAKGEREKRKGGRTSHLDGGEWPEHFPYEG